jgi:aspartyl/asparaginyl-tRNA synthetase
MAAMGTQSSNGLELLDRGIEEPGAYEWQRDLRQSGMVPCAGRGPSFDRTQALATGTANIHDVIPLRRTPSSADF